MRALPEQLLDESAVLEGGQPELAFEALNAVAPLTALESPFAACQL